MLLYSSLDYEMNQKRRDSSQGSMKQNWVFQHPAVSSHLGRYILLRNHFANTIGLFWTYSIFTSHKLKKNTISVHKRILYSFIYLFTL